MGKIFLKVCVYMYVCTYVCMHACMYVRMYACMYVCMHVCMHACMYVYIHVHNYVNGFAKMGFSQTSYVVNLMSYNFCSVCGSHFKLSHYLFVCFNILI